MVKGLLREILRRFGLQLGRIPEVEPTRSSGSESRQTLWLTALGIRTVLDIGANTGQFARRIRQVIPDAMIYSFEPLPDCFEQLTTGIVDTVKFSAFNVALSDQTGALPFERNDFSPSSSFLRMAELHREAFPYTSKSEAVIVVTRRLDDLSDGLTVTEPLLVKIDVQGYEDHVLRGGEQTIRRASVLIVETSFEPTFSF